MKFPYIPLDLIVDEALNECKTFNRQGMINRDDAYNAGIEAAKMAGGNNWDELTDAIIIKNHIGVLPRLFYTANGVWMAEAVVREITNVLDVFRAFNGIYYYKGIPLWPGDSSTTRLLTDKARTPDVPPDAPSFYFKVPPGTVRTSFRDGTIAINCNILPSDDKGVVMIQDEINNLIGVKSYIKYLVLEELYISEQVPRNIYKDIEAKAMLFIDQSKAIQKMPDHSQTEHFIDRMNNRYSGFKL